MHRFEIEPRTTPGHRAASELNVFQAAEPSASLFFLSHKGFSKLCVSRASFSCADCPQTGLLIEKIEHTARKSAFAAPFMTSKPHEHNIAIIADIPL